MRNASLAPTGADRLLPVFAALFVVSGAAGLIYEVVWTRYLVRVFGVTAFAVSTVLVSFMGGMALGAAWIGSRTGKLRRPLRLFALLEAGIAVYALFLPLLLRGADAVYAALLPSLPDAFLARATLRFVMSFAILLVPTILMGGTLPALGQGLLQRGPIGRGVGLLYFVNTLGAAIGCYVAGFHAIPTLGLQRSTLVAAGLNATVALVAWALDRRRPVEGASGASAPSSSEAPLEREPAARPPSAWPLVVVFFSGAAALAFEVVWFRVLVLSFGSTVYSFSAMLAIFLLGLALGSLVAGWLVERVRAPVRLLALVQAAAAATALLGHLSVNRMPELFLRIIRVVGFDLDGMNRTKLLLSAMTLLPAAVAFGATFPIAVQLYRAANRSAGSRIGRVYAWNTLGAITGSFGAGFLLLPAIGAENVLRIAVGVSLALALGSVLADPARLRVGWAALSGLLVVAIVAGLVFAPPWNRRLLGAGTYFDPMRFYGDSGEVRIGRVLADYQLRTFTEGYNDTIISYESPKGKFITVNGSTTASTQFEDMFSQRMMGHLPMALHPGNPKRACIVGLGAGVTAGAMALYELDELVAVELEEGVQVASRFFSEANDGVLDNPVVSVRIDDGRNYLKLTDERFDVISSHPNFPSLSGSGVLFSRDYFELSKERLRPGGVMCHYAPLWRILPEDVETIVASFTDVFPHVRVFSAGVSLILLGSEEPFPSPDLAGIRQRISRQRVAASLGEVGIHDPLDLLALYQFDGDVARRWTAAAVRTTDDRPRIEFSSPRGLFSQTVGPNLAVLRDLRSAPAARGRALGLAGEDQADYVERATAYDLANEAEIAINEGDGARAFELAGPVADSGQRFARFLLADYSQKYAAALQSDGRIDEAIGWFETALRYEPGRLESLVGLGYLHLLSGRIDAAEPLLTRAADAYPGSGWAQSCLALLLESRGDLAGAEARHRRAVEAQPMLARPHGLFGRHLLLTGRPDAALTEFEAARRLGERSEGVLAGRAEALLALGRPQRALRAARRALEAFPGSPGVLDLVARSARAAGDTSAEQEARRRLESDRVLEGGR
jgi:spermidine synthase